MLCMRGTSHRPVFVSVSVRNRRSTETANRRITQTTPHDSASEVTTLWRYTNLFIIIIIRRPIICTVKMLAVMVDLVSSCDRQTDRHTTVLRSPQWVLQTVSGGDSMLAVKRPRDSRRLGDVAAAESLSGASGGGDTIGSTGVLFSINRST